MKKNIMLGMVLATILASLGGCYVGYTEYDRDGIYDWEGRYDRDGRHYRDDRYYRDGRYYYRDGRYDRDRGERRYYHRRERRYYDWYGE